MIKSLRISAVALTLATLVLFKPEPVEARRVCVYDLCIWAGTFESSNTSCTDSPQWQCIGIAPG